MDTTLNFWLLRMELRLEKHLQKLLASIQIIVGLAISTHGYSGLIQDIKSNGLRTSFMSSKKLVELLFLSLMFQMLVHV